MHRRQLSTEVRFSGKLIGFAVVTLMISSVERGMASTMTHVMGTFFLFEMEVLSVVAVGSRGVDTVVGQECKGTTVSMTIEIVAVERYIHSSAAVSVWYAGVAASWRAKTDAYSSSQHYL